MPTHFFRLHIKNAALFQVRNRFEGNAAPSSSSSSASLVGHQTLPKTFKLGAASRVVPSSSIVAPRYSTIVVEIAYCITGVPFAVINMYIIFDPLLGRERTASERQSRHSMSGAGITSSSHQAQRGQQNSPATRAAQKTITPTTTTPATAAATAAATGRSASISNGRLCRQESLPTSLGAPQPPPRDHSSNNK